MAITLDGAVTTDEQTGTTSKAVADNADRLFIVSIGTHQSNNASGVTFNGVAMTLLKRQAGSYGEHCEIWGLLAPDVGTYNVVVSGANNWWAKGIYSIYDCEQELPSTGASTAIGANGDSSSCSVSVTTPVDNCLVIGVMSSEPVPTHNTSGGTEDWSQQGDSYQNAEGARILKATAGSQTMSWSLSYGGRWQAVAIAIKPKAGSTFVPKIVMID